MIRLVTFARMTLTLSVHGREIRTALSSSNTREHLMCANTHLCEHTMVQSSTQSSRPPNPELYSGRFGWEWMISTTEEDSAEPAPPDPLADARAAQLRCGAAVLQRCSAGQATPQRSPAPVSTEPSLRPSRRILAKPVEPASKCLAAAHRAVSRPSSRRVRSIRVVQRAGWYADRWLRCPPMSTAARVRQGRRRRRPRGGAPDAGPASKMPRTEAAWAGAAQAGRPVRLAHPSPPPPRHRRAPSAGRGPLRRRPTAVGSRLCRRRAPRGAFALPIRRLAGTAVRPSTRVRSGVSAAAAPAGARMSRARRGSSPWYYGVASYA